MDRLNCSANVQPGRAKVWTGTVYSQSSPIECELRQDRADRKSIDALKRMISIEKKGPKR
jgi:hypothetical protein